VHAFAGSASIFFGPTLATRGWTLTRKEFLPELIHVFAVLHSVEIGVGKIEFHPIGIRYLFFGQTTRTDRTNRTGLKADPGQ
jgi:hypothetical protein